MSREITLLIYHCEQPQQALLAGELASGDLHNPICHFCWGSEGPPFCLWKAWALQKLARDELTSDFLEEDLASVERWGEGFLYEMC